MQIAVLLIAVLLVGCATSGGERWVREDGSPVDSELLERDQMDCFPKVPQMGPGSMGLGEARDCMHRKGWRRPTS